MRTYTACHPIPYRFMYIMARACFPPACFTVQNTISTATHNVRGLGNVTIVKLDLENGYFKPILVARRAINAYELPVDRVSLNHVPKHP